MDELLIVNLADAPTFSHSRRATIIDFEPQDEPWPETGVNVQVMAPGKPNGRYHSESDQEDFLVLAGECTLIVNDEERTLRQWDFFHCPAGVPHIFVGAGEEPCAVLMIGARRMIDGRREEELLYPVSAVAAAYDASAKSETTDPDEAYADWSTEPWEPAPSPWPLS